MCAAEGKSLGWRGEHLIRFFVRTFRIIDTKLAGITEFRPAPFRHLYPTHHHIYLRNQMKKLHNSGEEQNIKGLLYQRLLTFLENNLSSVSYMHKRRYFELSFS